jgi:hypothetical protein
MKSKELIEKLKKLSPDGNMEVFIGDIELESVEKCEGRELLTNRKTYWIELS